MLSSRNEIVKQLVWNSLMKGLVLKVKADLFHVSLEPELLLCNFLGMQLAHGRPVPPTHTHSNITVNKPAQKHPTLFAEVLGAFRAPEGNSWHRGALGKWQGGGGWCRAMTELWS